jgi:hypothetical protein
MPRLAFVVVLKMLNLSVQMAFRVIKGRVPQVIQAWVIQSLEKIKCSYLC